MGHYRPGASGGRGELFKLRQLLIKMLQRLGKRLAIPWILCCFQIAQHARACQKQGLAASISLGLVGTHLLACGVSAIRLRVFDLRLNRFALPATRHTFSLS